MNQETGSFLSLLLISFGFIRVFLIFGCFFDWLLRHIVKLVETIWVFSKFTNVTRNLCTDLFSRVPHQIRFLIPIQNKGSMVSEKSRFGSMVSLFWTKICCFVHSVIYESLSSWGGIQFTRKNAFLSELNLAQPARNSKDPKGLSGSTITSNILHKIWNLSHHVFPPFDKFGESQRLDLHCRENGDEHSSHLCCEGVTERPSHQVHKA